MTVKTSTELKDIIATDFADNTNGDITPAVLREFAVDLVDSSVKEVDDSLHDPLWKDLVSPLGQARDSNQNIPAWEEIGASGIYAHKFVAASKRELQVTFHMGHDYKLGTDIFPHIHWMPETATAGTIRWVMEFIYAKGHQQEPFNVVTPNTLIIEQASTGIAYTHMVAEGNASVITPDLEPDGVLMVRIYRDGDHVNDTYPDDVFGFQLDLHYQADRDGTINKAPDFYN